MWLSIESAPNDGTAIWLSDGFAMRIGFWREGKQYENHGSKGGGWRDFYASELNGKCDVQFLPTLWQRLPDPPNRDAMKDTADG